MIVSALITGISWSFVTQLALADEDPAPTSVNNWKSRLTAKDVEVRRQAAIATLSTDKALQVELLPVLIKLLEDEKDGQVR